MTAGFLPVTHQEATLGTAIGSVEVPMPLPRTHRSARAMLEELVRREIASGRRVHVLFSGGRDSSTVLAVATTVARRLGADDPVPVTGVYPRDELASESDWQRLVLDHLRIRERIVVEIDDERRVLGAVARSHLERHGLTWPQAVQTQSVFFSMLPEGSSILTGEGGDLVLDAHRGTPIYLTLSAFPRVRRAHLRAVRDAFVPGALLLRAIRAKVETVFPWLTPAGAAMLAKDQLAERGPLRWDESTRRLLHRRANVLIDHNSVKAASECGVRLRHPFTEPEFLSAIATEGGPGGFRGRTHIFRHLASDLLPDEILSRTSKAAFNVSRWGQEERAFAEEWDGWGLDENLVDPVALRRHWLGDRPLPFTFTALQAAWLATKPPATGVAMNVRGGLP